MEIAKTIHAQLMGFGKLKVWSWGASGWTAGKESLTFRVRARRHKGYVQITLNSMDLYDVQLISTHGNVKKEMNGLYFDQLTEVIDRAIEYVPTYRD